MKIMKFPFSAPLQSWGEDARWDNRSTAVIPTKSGIIGFLGCCLGYSRGDERLSQLNDKLFVAVRIDRPGEILTDFQTVQGSGGVFLNAEGKKRSGGGTIITPKQYLQNSRFTIFLQGDELLMEECYNAIRDPKWTPYLGRKNCIPSIPIIPEWVDAGTLDEAVRCFSDKEQKDCGKTITVEMDLAASPDVIVTERTYTRIDSAVHAEKNEYHSRSVKSYTVQGGGDPS